jgi:uncharacterized protein YjbI with pentapeptide repeats
MIDRRMFKEDKIIKRNNFIDLLEILVGLIFLDGLIFYNASLEGANLSGCSMIQGSISSEL